MPTRNRRGASTLARSPELNDTAKTQPRLGCGHGFCGGRTLTGPEARDDAGREILGLVEAVRNSFGRMHTPTSNLQDPTSSSFGRPAPGHDG